MRWLTVRTVAIVSALALVVYLLFVVAWVHDARTRPARLSDYVGTWVAARMALDGRAAATYDDALLLAEEMATIVPHTDGLLDWVYPPHTLLLAVPLGLPGYFHSLFVWNLSQLLVFLGVVLRVSGSWFAVRTALGFPGVIVNAGYGQNGLVTTSLLGLGVDLLDTRPVLAGVVLGLLAYKPHLFLLVPVALLAGRRWKALSSLAALGVAWAAATSLAFGPGIWRVYLDSLHGHANWLFQSVHVFPIVPTTFAMLRMAGVAPHPAMAAQVLVALGATAALVWVWTRPGLANDLKGAVLALATLLAIPKVVVHDLCLLAWPMLWLARDAVARGRGGPVLELALVAAWGLPYLSIKVGERWGLQPCPLVEAWLLGLVLVRARELEAATGARDAAAGPGVPRC